MVRLIISGLFHRAIAQSGSCLNSWAFTNSSKRMAFRLGEKLGIKTENPQELLNHLRSLDTKALTKASHEVLTPEASVHITTTHCPTQSLLHLRHYAQFLTNCKYTVLLLHHMFNVYFYRFTVHSVDYLITHTNTCTNTHTYIYIYII